VCVHREMKEFIYIESVCNSRGAILFRAHNTCKMYKFTERSLFFCSLIKYCMNGEPGKVKRVQVFVVCAARLFITPVVPPHIERNSAARRNN